MPSRRRSRFARSLSVVLLSAAGAVALVPSAASAATSAIIDDSGCTTNSMGLNDDNSTEPIPLSSALKFYGRDIAQTRVSNNGAFFMDDYYGSYVAPFYTDLDSRSTGTPVTYGQTTFEGHPALCANWLNIGYYALGTAPTVDVQGLLVDRSDVRAGDFDIVFNYGRIGGTPYSPTIGFYSYDDSGAGSYSYSLPSSGQQGAFDDSSETGLIHGSRESSVLGRYVFRFRNGQPVGIAPPDTSITTGPDGLSSDASPSFTYTSTAADEHQRFECRLSADGELAAAFETCPDDGTTYADLPDGSYTFDVRAVDSSDNTDTTPSFTYSSTSSDAASFECLLSRPDSLEQSPWESCAVEGIDYPALGDGDWSFQVRGVDALGNADATPASYDFVIDTEATGVSIVTAPAMLGNDATPSFTYLADPADDVDFFECAVVAAGASSASPSTCAADGFTSEPLEDGDYTFSVRVTDGAGNTGDAVSFDFTIDTVAGDTRLTASPKALGNDTTPSFGYASDATDLDHFECYLSSATSRVSFSDCADAGATYGPLADGDYTFEVRSVDLAGNADAAPAAHAFTVDTAAPETTVGQAPATVGTDSATFGFASDADPSTFECRLSGSDPAAWQACAGPSKTFTGLVDGDYLFEVRATDAAGNTDATPATSKVRVNVGKPTITAALSSEFPVSAAGWHRSAVTITYTCAGNGSALVGACPAPRLVPRASHGRTITASIATADGDTASVRTTVYIDKGKPSLDIKGFAGTKVYTAMPKPRCAASDPRSGLDECTITVKKVTRQDGDRFIVVRARATDLAGNVRVVTKRAPFRAA